MAELDGTWDVRRESGALPPLAGLRKRIAGTRGRTIVARRVGVAFDVRGLELHYRPPLRGVVDVLEPSDDGFRGRTEVAGRTVGTFTMTRVEESAMGSVDDRLDKHLDEAIAMEENVKRMLDGMIATSDEPAIVDLLEHHKAETETHSRRLRERLQARGGRPSQIREAGGVLGALMKSVLDLARTEQAGRNARDAYAAEHMEIASYELLERVAQAAGDEETAQVARENRADEEAMAARIREHWDLFAELSLREEGVTERAGPAT